MTIKIIPIKFLVIADTSDELDEDAESIPEAILRAVNALLTTGAERGGMTHWLLSLQQGEEKTKQENLAWLECGFRWDGNPDILKEVFPGEMPVTRRVKPQTTIESDKLESTVSQEPEI